MSWWARRHRPPTPVTTADSTGTAGTGSGTGGGTGAVATTPQSSPPPNSGGSSTPAAGAPHGAAPGASAAIIGSGPKVPHSPIVERELKTDLFDATFTSQGGTISKWVLPKYRDLAHGNVPVNLVPEGQRTLRLWVSTPYFNYDFTNVPFRVEAAAAFDSSVTFVAEDSSGIRIQQDLPRRVQRPSDRPRAEDPGAARIRPDPVPLRLGQRASGHRDRDAPARHPRGRAGRRQAGGDRRREDAEGRGQGAEGKRPVGGQQRQVFRRGDHPRFGVGGGRSIRRRGRRGRGRFHRGSSAAGHRDRTAGAASTPARSTTTR